MLAGKEEINELLPQKPPMVMVDGLLSHDDQRTVSTLTIAAENIFVDKGVLIESGLIENIAQTAALRNGWSARARPGGKALKTPPVGVIGGIKNLRIHALPAVGSRIVTEITVITEIMNATVVAGKVEAGGVLFAECEMKIFLQEPA